MKKDQLLIIFVRNPQQGKVKTRLAKSIGDDSALAVYLQLLEHTAQVTESLKVLREVHYSEAIPEEELWDGYGIKLQQGAGLGERMLFAFQEGFQRGYGNIVLIGSDIPDLEMQDIQAAFSALKNSDYVLGPAKDGGYYLIGMKSLNSDIFRNKPWGTPSVLQETLKELENESVSLLVERNDLDTYDDLKVHPLFRQYLKNKNDQINTRDY